MGGGVVETTNEGEQARMTETSIDKEFTTTGLLDQERSSHADNSR